MGKDEFFMSKAINLAKRSFYKTSPNPLVGAIIVKNGRVLGKGYHKKFGMPHAEIEAIRSVKNKQELKGATLYVNLEPCNHHGKTPPCSEAIIESGIGRVVIGMRDPNPVARGGVERLRDASIDVEVGVLERECRKLNEVFITNVVHERPFFVMKAAMLLNGAIAVKGGVSKWITSQESLRYAQRLRGMYDGVLVGVNTIIMDDPMLTCRLRGYKQPRRIVLDTNLRVPVSAKIFAKFPENVYVLCSDHSDDKKRKTLMAMGVNVVVLKDRKGVFDPVNLSRRLFELGIYSVLVEGGSRVHGYFVDNKMYDKAYLFFAPRICGSYGSFNVVGSEAPSSLGAAEKLIEATCKRVGDDFLLEGYFKDV